MGSLSPPRRTLVSYRCCDKSLCPSVTETSTHGLRHSLEGRGAGRALRPLPPEAPGKVPPPPPGFEGRQLPVPWPLPQPPGPAPPGRDSDRTRDVLEAPGSSLLALPAVSGVSQMAPPWLRVTVRWPAGSAGCFRGPSVPTGRGQAPTVSLRPVTMGPSVGVLASAYFSRCFWCALVTGTLKRPPGLPSHSA